jgi:Skp family chaperone for outer membrane proteins
LTVYYKKRSEVMKKRVVTALGTVLAAILVWLGTGEAQAIKIGYVDFVDFAAKSKRAQEEQKRFAELVASKRDALEKKKNELIAKQDELQKQGPMLKEETRNDKIKEIGIKEMELKLAEKEAENLLRNEQREAQEVFQRDVVKLIGQIRQQKGLTLVINAQALLSADDSLNITDDVVRAYDAQASSAKPVPAKPASGPAKPKPTAPAADKKGQR